ncbi:hypothetical protein I3271_09160 [Photobacterium leiognathi]|uniref:hypothetical protein n=1 Tax=Photobacterium leiognathi TaxID=553611 RepID=UPI001EE10DC6|nr:hypothetical protein [Photobacterium leiognathi]MCG3884857.1 hypothetical protein [Photobacterium leiognathi]
MNNNGIYFIHCGTRKLHDKKHAEHFIKHLCSATTGHVSNSRTHLNYIRTFDYENLMHNQKECLDFAMTALSLGLQECNHEISSAYAKDLSSVFYFIPAKPYAITNMVEIIENNELNWLIRSEDLELIIKKYYNEDPDKFYRDFNETLKEREVVSIDMFPAHTVLEISRIIVDTLESEHRSEGTLIHSIHNDEGSCHIHRIIKKLEV